MTGLEKMVSEAAAEADKQFAGATHVTAEQIDAAAAAACRRVAASAQALVLDGLTEAIKAKMQAKPVAPKKAAA